MKEALMDNMIKYFESEYNYTRAFIEREFSLAKPREVVDNTIQRCLGVAMYVQNFDDTLSYDEIEQIYNHYRKQLEELLD